jgi:hypothetical protein
VCSVCAAYGGPATEGGGSRGRAERSFARSTRYSSEQRTVVAQFLYYKLHFRAPPWKGALESTFHGQASPTGRRPLHMGSRLYTSRLVNSLGKPRDAFLPPSYKVNRPNSVCTCRSPCPFSSSSDPALRVGLQDPTTPFSHFLLPVRGRPYV